MALRATSRAPRRTRRDTARVAPPPFMRLDVEELEPVAARGTTSFSRPRGEPDEDDLDVGEPAQRVGHGEPGKDVAAGAAARDDDAGGARRRRSFGSLRLGGGRLFFDRRGRRAVSSSFGAVPPWREMLSRMPAAAAFTISDEPPKLTNGSVRPFVGSSDSATERFKSACTPNIVEMPNARYAP